MMFIQALLLWISWNPFKLFIQRIPARYTYLIARASGIFIYHVSRDRRKRLERELDFVLGHEASGEKRKRMVQEAFAVLLCNELEVLAFPILNENNISSFVSCSGLENLDRALSNGKGVMLLFAHFGANQMIMPAIGYRGYQMKQLSAPPMVWKEKLPNKQFSPMAKKALEVRWKHEQSLPVTHINIFGSLKEALLCLRRNEILGVAIDGGGGKNKVAVNFLGREALFSTGSMEIAVRTGCSVLSTFMIRKKNGRSTMIIEPSLRLQTGTDEQETVQVNIQLFVERLEHFVLRHPSHYLNFLALRRFMAEQGDDPLFTEGEKT